MALFYSNVQGIIPRCCESLFQGVVFHGGKSKDYSEVMREVLVLSATDEDLNFFEE